MSCIKAKNNEKKKIINVISKQQIIEKTAQFAKETLYHDSSGHDWWHVFRVWKLAKNIAEKEGGDSFVVELAALLHDIADWKFHDGNEFEGPRQSKKWLQSLSVDEETIDHVYQIIKNISFKGAGVITPMKTKEGMIVQDADRLDAMGAIGVARCFAYGGYKKNAMYDPDVRVVMHQTSKEYKTNKSTSVNHFYEKLLLLKDRMNTKAGLAIAQKRHAYMELFLDRFFQEWEGC